MTLAIEAEGLIKTFKTTRAVDGVDLAVQQGSVYGVLGPNGAGKTTTIKMLITLLLPTSGQARVLGRDVVDARGRGEHTPELEPLWEQMTEVRRSAPGAQW